MKEPEFKELLQSIQQMREIYKGERRPARAFHYEPVRVKSIRRRLGLTQKDFAKMICIHVATLRNWEQGRTYPEGAAIALLRVAEAEPKAVLSALHAA